MREHRLKAKFLLIILLCLIFTTPLYHRGEVFGIVLNIAYIVAIAFGGYLLQPTKKWLRFYLILSVPLLLSSITVSFVDHPITFVVHGLLISLVQLQMLRAVFTHSLLSENVHVADRVIAGICGYLIMAILFGNVYRMIYYFQPDSFEGIMIGDTDEFVDLLYFSLVTLSTLGYGDITPVYPFVRLISAMQGVFGTLYVSVFIASLVAEIKFANHIQDDE